MHNIDLMLMFNLQGKNKEARKISDEIEKAGPFQLKDNNGQNTEDIWLRHSFNRGWFLIQDGDYQKGCQLLESGRFLNVYGSPPLKTTSPIYDPSKHNIKNKSIILSLEGGYGDEIIHARFATSFKKLGAKKVYIASSPGLKTLFSHIEGVDKVILRNESHTVQHDFWIPGFSSGWVAGHTFDNFPNSAYLTADKRKIDDWKKIIRSNKIKVGIRWAGNPQFEHEQYRKFPNEFIINLSKYKELQLYSLQRDDNLVTLPKNIIDLQNKIISWEDTAAAIMNLDLVITSCTSIAHLSAALGKETWVMVPILPYHTWAVNSPNSITTPYYKCVTLFRQNEYMKWNGAFQKMYLALEKKYNLKHIELPNVDINLTNINKIKNEVEEDKSLVKNSMEFLITLQTHNKSNNQDSDPNFKRYGCNDKTEIIKRCTRSLIKSINYAQDKLPGWNFKLNIFDDHSTDFGVQTIKNNLELANFPTKFFTTKKTGLLESLRECYTNMRDEGKDLVMQVQDDYLFDEQCFYQMVLQWLKFNSRFSKPISLLPWDDPYRYWDHNIVPIRIVHGPDRHWRQTYQTPCTFMTHHSVIVNEWDLFDKICNGNPLDKKLEDESINRLWQERDYVVMNPIPSLALHFQGESEKDPYIDWQSWWNKNADETVSTERKKHIDLFKSNKKIVLNVGCGKTKLEIQSKYFIDWKEIRVDAYENETADLITSIVDLNKVPNESVDAVWASHVIEHNYWHDLPKIFNSMLRVLKSDGFGIIRVPNLGSIAHLIKDGLLDTVYDSSYGPVSVIDVIYGHRGFVESWGDGMCHKTGFTEKSMKQLLEFLNIKAYVKSNNLEVIAIIFKGKPLQDLPLDFDLII